MDYSQCGDAFIIRLHRGESLFPSLEQLANTHGWKAGHLTGFGAATSAELGRYSLGEKQYLRKKFPVEMEVASLVGNLSISEEKTFFHIHGVFATDNYCCVGGHLFELIVGATCEIVFFPLSTNLTRELDPAIGLNLLKLDCCGISTDHP